MRRTFVIGLLLLSARGYAADCTSTKPAVGGTCTDPTYGNVVTRATNWSSQLGAPATCLREDYSRRQAFNADNTLYIVYACGAGSWHLYNASDNTRIRTMTGLGGDAEPIWNPTNPDKLWYVPTNGGLVLNEYTASTDATVVAKNWTTPVRAIWPTAARVWTHSEGSPSADGRYWAFMVETSDFGILGMFTYDMQTDTIIASKSLTVAPDSTAMTASGRYVVMQWNNQSIGEAQNGKVRAYTRDLTDWTWIDCQGNHMDFAIGIDGHDYMMAVDYSNGGDASCSNADGNVFIRDIDAGWQSQTYATARTNIIATYPGDGTVRSFHFSGKAFDKPGYFLASAYGCRGAAGCPVLELDNKVMLINIATHAIQYLTETWNDCINYYFCETQASISRDGTKAIFNSNWGGALDSTDVDTYIVDITTALAITTTTLAQGTVGQTFPDCVLAAGGTAPRTFALAPASDPLPTGLTLTSAGCFTGTFSAAATFTPTFRVTDDVAATDDQQISWVVNATLQIDTTTLPDGTQGSGYATCLESSGGTPPYTYSLNAGSNPLPTGLTLTSAGCFTGTIEQTGVYTPTFKVTDDVAATDTQQITWTVGSGAFLSMDGAVITALDTSVVVKIGATGLPYENDCNAILRDSGGIEIDSATSASGFARRTVIFTGLTASSVYSLILTCDGATPDLTPHPFTTLAAASGGDRTVPIVFGDSHLTAAARVTVEYDDNEALSSSATVQNTSCGSGCTVNLTIPAGLYWYRHKWQDGSDNVLATSKIQPLLVE